MDAWEKEGAMASPAPPHTPPRPRDSVFDEARTRRTTATAEREASQMVRVGNDPYSNVFPCAGPCGRTCLRLPCG
jgi:hypothetical protein